jgi:hypothetical protein
LREAQRIFALVTAVRLNLGGPAAVRDAYAASPRRWASPARRWWCSGWRNPAWNSSPEWYTTRCSAHSSCSASAASTPILADRAFRLLPLTDLDATAMWRSLRGAPLLTGYRGSSTVDTGALEDLLQRVGRLAEDLPEVAELDLNPVLAGPGGVLAVDVKLRLAPVTGEPDSYVRSLREPGTIAEENPHPSGPAGEDGGT